LHQGWAILMPSLAEISAVVTVVSKNHSLSTLQVLFVDVDGCPYLSASTTLVWLLSNILIHSYTLHCGKQFCPYLAANCRWISAPFIPKPTIACCLSLVQTSSGAVIFMPCSLGTDKLQLNHTCSMTRPQQCCQSYNENIPILLLFFYLLHINIPF
jgi:hypothetical protein